MTQERSDSRFAETNTLLRRLERRLVVKRNCERNGLPTRPWRRPKGGVVCGRPRRVRKAQPMVNGIPSCRVAGPACHGLAWGGQTSRKPTHGAASGGRRHPKRSRPAKGRSRANQVDGAARMYALRAIESLRVRSSTAKTKLGPAADRSESSKGLLAR